jgi:hypothetical protein
MGHAETAKVPPVECLRGLITDKVPDARETGRAEADLLAISFQSTVLSDRHVWVSFFEQMSFPFWVDLEDWTYEATWDNAVARVHALTADAAAGLCVAWLGGASLDDCLKLSRRDRALRVVD